MWIDTSSHLSNKHKPKKKRITIENGENKN